MSDSQPSPVPVAPALTPSEWADLGLRDWAGEMVLGSLFGERFGRPCGRQAWAALCLRGQPFGFSAEDVRDLNESSLDIMAHCAGYCSSLCDCRALADRVRRIATRISALLPPQETI